MAGLSITNIRGGGREQSETPPASSSLRSDRMVSDIFRTSTTPVRPIIDAQLRREADALIQTLRTAIEEMPTQSPETLQTRHRELKRQVEEFNTRLILTCSSVGEDSQTAILLALGDLPRGIDDLFLKYFQDELLSRFPGIPIDYGDLLRSATKHRTQDFPSLSLELKRLFPYYNRVRGDGNCFYTSFTIIYLQWICQHPEQIDALRVKIRELPDYNGKIEMLTLLDHLNPQSLETVLNSSSQLLICISFLRHCAAYQLNVLNTDWKADYSQPTSIDPETADEYISRHVLKMGKDAEEYEISAISQYLDCSFWILDSDQAQLTPYNRGIPVGVIYRVPGHYSYLQQNLDNRTTDLSPEDVTHCINAQHQLSLIRSIEKAEEKKAKAAAAAAQKSAAAAPKPATSAAAAPAPTAKKTEAPTTAQRPVPIAPAAPTATPTIDVLQRNPALPAASPLSNRRIEPINKTQHSTLWNLCNSITKFALFIFCADCALFLWSIFFRRR